MKVLTLREPWASLIKEKIKFIETRSFKTKYRGELYIHVSKKELTNKENVLYQEQLSLLKNKDFIYGYIIIKCQLFDCLYMDEDLINNIKNNHNEYICGEYKVGRYAWILKDIEVLKAPIKATGQLGIWNYNTKNYE